MHEPMQIETDATPGDAHIWSQLYWTGGSVDAKTHLLDYCTDYLRRAADAFQGSGHG
jgi:hypothetical protein